MKADSEFLVWVPVVSSAVGGVMAIAGGVVTQVIIACKEKKAQAKMLASERAFIGAGLILYLKEYRYQCNRIASDTGELRPAAGGELERVPVRYPLLPLMEDVEGNWTVIPGALMLRIRQLPLSQQAHERYLAIEKDVHDDYPEHHSFYRERQARYRKLAAECTWLEQELRQLCGLPMTGDTKPTSSGNSENETTQR